jgi:hypothetical protein
MATTDRLSVSDLSVDLNNFRTVPQASEEDAVQAMITTSPDWFWALLASLLDDGYLPTESILVLRGPGNNPLLIVKEGNRRVAAIKLIQGDLKKIQSKIPPQLAQRIEKLPPEWLKENKTVPCIIYELSEEAKVDRIVTLAHGKGEKAGRDHWNAVARSRHNRRVNGASEPALDVLEKYIAVGQNRTPTQAAQWAGDYPLSVLDEALKKLAPRVGLKSAKELADTYPAITGREGVEEIIKAIGQDLIGFEAVRNQAVDFAEEYGFPPERPKNGKGTAGQGGTGSGTKSGSPKGKGKTKTASLRDPKNVKALLRRFEPMGRGKEKVVLLRDEARALDLRDNPLAFCFVVRSMFEISAKAYCQDHKKAGGPSYTKPNSEDKKLVDVLRDITKHLTKNKSDKIMTKILHGAMTELGRQDGILSVTSMNQLVHNENFSVNTGDVCVLFANIFPLLETMNA